MARWRQVQRKRHVNSSLKVIAVLVIAFAVLNLTLKFSEITAFFQKPISKNSASDIKFASPNFNYRFNLLLLVTNQSSQINQVTLASFDNSSDKTLDLLQIPLDSPLSLDEGKATTKMENYLGLPLDGFVSFSDNAVSLSPVTIKNLKESLNFSSLLKLPDLYSFVNKNVKTSLSFKDILSVLMKLSSIRGDKIVNHPVLLPKNLDDQIPDGAFEKDFADASLLNEGAKIEVRNASGVSGLAYTASRFINNLGGNVINLATDNDTNQSVIYEYFSRPRTVEYLSRVFKAKVVVQKKDNARSDIVVVIGRDFGDRYK